jgi:hypothetical protein
MDVSDGFQPPPFEESMDNVYEPFVTFAQAREAFARAYYRTPGLFDVYLPTGNLVLKRERLSATEDLDDFKVIIAIATIEAALVQFRDSLRQALVSLDITGGDNALVIPDDLVFLSENELSYKIMLGAIRAKLPDVLNELLALQWDQEVARKQQQAEPAEPTDVTQDVSYKPTLDTLKEMLKGKVHPYVIGMLNWAICEEVLEALKQKAPSDGRVGTREHRGGLKNPYRTAGVNDGLMH